MDEIEAKRGARAKAITKRWRGIALAFVAGCALLAAVLLWPMNTARYLAVDASGEIVDRRGETLMAFLNREEQWCFPRPLKEISPYLVKATIAAEDQRFREHPGVDPIAVIRAASQNLRSQGVVSGASTLTMQVVKNGPASSRSWVGKALQTIDAIRLDARVSKDRILETYLNSAPYGLNLVGCEAAARRYFGVPARELDIAEAALLAGLPKSPTGFMPLAHPEEARQRRDYVLGRMLEEGYIDQKDFDRAIDTPLDVSWHEYPMLSPHLAMRLEPRAHTQGRVITTLDLTIQAKVESIVAEHMARWSGEITNAAVLVVDVDTASVLARIGSGGFFHTPGGGQVDACRALRSPGSTLKPFIYGYAMENDLVYPCETLYDGTLDYGRYNPANFDGSYNGLVSASEALRYSLNVPAITVLDRIGVEDFCAFLPTVGIRTAIKAPESYGLGLALGNCEVRLEEMAAAYCAIANEGEYRPLRTLASDLAAEPKRCLSRGTCQALYAMLEQPLPEEFDAELVPVRNSTSRACWKTGTSAGYRDAWAFSFNRNYVVGVWMGNNDGTASKRLVGSEAALPLAAEVFLRLPPAERRAWPDEAEDMKAVNVCALSGLPAAKWCPHSRTARVPREQHMLRVCDVHYPAADGTVVPAHYVERWPGSALKWDLAAVGAGRTPALSNPVGPKTREDELRILNPSNQAVFVLTGEDNGDCIKLRASTESKSVLYWYLDKSYVGESRPGSPVLLNLEEGAHQLTCMNPQGAIDSVAFEVALPETSSLKGS